MKTITEFVGAHLKQAHQIKNQVTTELTAAGKTAEELSAGLAEAIKTALKVEGEKLTHLLNALETVGEKFNDLKRVVIYTLAEGEKAPSKSQQKGEHHFLAEYYPPLADKNRPRGGADREQGRGGKRGRDGKDGKRGGKHGRGKRGDRDQNRDGARADRPQRDPNIQNAAAPGAGGESKDGDPNRRRRRRPPRGPRREAAPVDPSKITGKIIPRPRPVSDAGATAGAENKPVDGELAATRKAATEALAASQSSDSPTTAKTE